MPAFYLIFAALIAADVAWWRWADRRLRSASCHRSWRIALALFVGSLTACMVVFLVAPAAVRRAHGVIPLPLHAMVYLWHLLVLPATGVVLLLAGAGRGVLWTLGGQRRSRAVADDADDAAPAADSPPAPSRRQFLGAAAVALPPLAAAGLVGWGVSQLGEFRVNAIDLRIPNLPPDLDGLRIAHLSDMHVGKFTVNGMLPRVADAANRDPAGRRPHLILLTGDLIDLSITDLPAALDFVRRLDPLHGLTMCEGNHDLIDKPTRFYADVASAGVPLLLDQEMTLQLPGRPTPVQLLGLRWSAPANGHGRGGESQIEPAMQRLLPQRRPGAFPILLAHHPHAFDPAAAAGFPLTLAGHTHGGQVMLTRGLGPGPLVYRYWSGLYRQGDSQLFVSNGVGNWFPLRVNAPAEVVHLTLRRA